jgi:hypothetical protein
VPVKAISIGLAVGVSLGISLGISPSVAMAQGEPDPNRQYMAPAQDPPPVAPADPSGSSTEPGLPPSPDGSQPRLAGEGGQGSYGFDQHPDVRKRGKRDGATWEANADLRVSYIDRIPELKISQDVAGPRSLSSGTVVHGNTSLVTAGLGFDFGLVLDDRWRIGGFGGSYESSIGTSARRRAYVDGSIAELRPWTASRFGFDFGGVGQRFKHRRWQFGWLVTGSVIVTTMNVSVANGASSEDAWGAAVALSFHGQAEACRRLDLESRVCLVVAPDVFDGGYFMRGGSVFARWEWGR